MRSRRSLWAFTSVAAVLSVWFIPGLVVRVMYGNFPIGNPEKYGIHTGMTRQEVLAVLGPPHARDGPNQMFWRYRCDSLGLSTYMVEFDDQGRVDDDDW